MISRQRLFSVVGCLAVLGWCSQAHGQLAIDVTGVPGSGVTTWSFSTPAPGIATLGGTVRDNTFATFSAFDTGQFPFGQDTILDPIADTVFPLTGNAMITIGGESQPISGIFIDDDGGSADDMGVRALVALDYLAGEASSWTGSGTVPLDINTFVLGPWSMNSTQGQAMFFSDPTLVTFTAVPEPSGLAILATVALGLVGLLPRKS